MTDKLILYISQTNNGWMIVAPTAFTGPTIIPSPNADTVWIAHDTAELPDIINQILIRRLPPVPAPADDEIPF